MKGICYCSVLLVFVFLIACQGVKQEEEDPDPPKVEKKKIDFDPQVLYPSVWCGTRASDGHLIYMKLEDSSSLFLFEIDTNKNEYIETTSLPHWELRDSTCFLLNYDAFFGPKTAYTLLSEHFLNDDLQDSLFRKITSSKESEYKAIKKKYFPMHFKNNIEGKLNLYTLDEITFQNPDGKVIVRMKKDTFYSKYGGTFFEDVENNKRSSAVMEYSFTTDSSYNTYYCSISRYKDGESKHAYQRERLKGEKEIKWVGNLKTTYTRDYLIINYKPVKYAVEHKRPLFVKIMELDSSLYKYPIEGRY